MKIIDIPYNSANIHLKLVNDIKIDIIKPKTNKKKKRFNIGISFNSVIASKQWTQFIGNLKQNEVLIVINDATRATPSKILIERLIKYFNNNKISFKFIIATGSHLKPSKQDLKIIFGKILSQIEDNNIFCHDSRDNDSLTNIGSTSFDTQVFLNKTLFSEKFGGIISINSIEPHYFAGFTGGRKSIVPGLAGYKTIKNTHKHALDPESYVCRLTGNPVHDDLQEGFEIFLKRIKELKKQYFTFQFVLDSKGNIQELFSGDHSVFNDGVRYASSIFQIPIDFEYELIISVAFPPLDRTLYQAHKALENAKNALNKSKSVFILVAACQDGIGPRNFLIPFENNINASDNEIFNDLVNHYELGYHKSGKILEALEYAELYLYSELKPGISEIARFKSISDLEECINNLIIKGGLKRVLIILDGCLTVPVIK